MFVIFAAALAAVACVVLALRDGGPLWLLLWPALGFVLVAYAYARGRPGVFGTRADGRRAGWARVVFAPIGVWIELLSLLEGWTVREAPAHEVAPGLWVARRPTASNLPPGTRLVVDLTAEFRPYRGVRDLPHRFLPTLDATSPDLEAAGPLLEEIDATEGAVVIHCASGHGRSATLAAAVLLRRGLAADPDEAVAKLKAVRPGVRLSAGQRGALWRWFEGTLASPARGGQAGGGDEEGS